jgi:hypothetical protein
MTAGGKQAYFHAGFLICLLVDSEDGEKHSYGTSVVNFQRTRESSS